MFDLQFPYKQINKSIDDFLDILNELNIPQPKDSPLEKAFLDSWQIWENFNKGGDAPTGENVYSQYANFCALNDYVQWIKRIGGPQKVKENGLVNHLALLKDALVSPALVVNDDHSRKILELIIALNLLRFVDEIDIDDCEHSNSETEIPDLCFKIKDNWYAIECKTPTTENEEGLWKNIGKAASQICNYKKHPLTFGIPMLSPRNHTLTKGLFEKIPFANYQIPLKEFSNRLKELLKPMRDERFVTEICKPEYHKSTKGFGLFENVITKVMWGIDQFAITNLKVCDYFPMSNSDPNEAMACRIIRELNHQIQMQDDFLYFGK